MTPNRVSVITAVRPGAADHLQQCADSIGAQQLPEGWTIEWCLQVDGPPGVAAPKVAYHVDVSEGRSTARYGPAIARNLALGRATGSLVKTLDADDQLAPGQLSREIEVFAEHPDTQWITSSALDLFTDGTTVSFDDEPVAGPLAPQSLRRYWSAHERRLPVHPATLCARHVAVCALGGWMALPASEDTGLLLALDARWPGYFLATPGLLYRKWPSQLSARAEHVDDENRRARAALIEARLAALDQVG
jgi:glycosyltransferase involved in cell wall biosynthesis